MAEEPAAGEGKPPEPAMPAAAAPVPAAEGRPEAAPPDAAPVASPKAEPPRRRRRPMRRRSKALILVGVLLGLVLGGVFGVSWQAGQALLHPERDLDPLTPSSLNMTWEWANFTTADGVPIVGWWIPVGNATAAAAGAANGTVIFLHGYSDSKAQGLALFPMLRNASVNVLSFDFRAHGQSGGGYTTAGLSEVLEVDAAISWASNRTGQGEDRIVLLGWSMGAAAALNAAPRHPRLAGVVAESSFSRLQNIVDTSIGKFTGLPRWPFGPLAVAFASSSVGVDIGDNTPANAVAGYAGPLLLIQGLNDTTVLPFNVDEIAAAAPQATVWRVPGAEHTDCYRTDPEGYESQLAAFLARSLPPPRPSPT